MRHGEVEHQITAPSGVLQVVEDLNVTPFLPILGAGRDTMLRSNPVTCCAELMLLFIGTHSVPTTLTVHSRSRSFVGAIDLRGLAPSVRLFLSLIHI